MFIQLILFALLFGHLIIGSLGSFQYGMFSQGPGTVDKIVCYYDDWASGRGGRGRFVENNLLYAPCTHVIYSYATLNEYTNKLEYHFTSSLIPTLKNNGVKVMLAVGGDVDSRGEKYSRMASTPQSRNVFINSVIQTLNQYGFDGLDVDWEYPTCHSGVDSCGGFPQDKTNFVSLIRELRQALYGKLLTIATHPGGFVVNQAYDIPALVDQVDWFNVMTYDLHESWEPVAQHHSPLYADDQSLTTDSSTLLYKLSGVPPAKIVIGVPLYGKPLRLANPSQHGYGAPISGAGDPGPYTQEAGMLSYLEICEMLRNYEWRVEQGTDKAGPIAYGNGQMVGFDDVKMAERKARYAKEQGLGGVFVWAISNDDFGGFCNCGKYPLVSALYNTLISGSSSQDCQL